MADLFKLLASLTAAPLNKNGSSGSSGKANGSSSSGSGNQPPALNGGGGKTAAAVVTASRSEAEAAASESAVAAVAERGCGCDDFGAVGTRITIPGFYDGVRPRLIDLAWAGLEECDEFSMESYQ
jgi:hypothetical protein